MAEPRGRLIIVCGLPGAGKTTIATELTARHKGVRYSPDDWMDAIGINLWDETARAGIERLQSRLVLRDQGNVADAAEVQHGDGDINAGTFDQGRVIDRRQWRALPAGRDVSGAKVIGHGEA